jgi:hypothetical protein
VYAPGHSRSSTGQGEAQEIAIAALGWIAEDAERLQLFLAASGLGPQNLRSAARDSGFLAAVLDFLASNESLLIAFADHQQTSPERVMQAHVRLNPTEARDET